MEKRKHAVENSKYLEKSKIENREVEGGKEIKRIERKSTNETNKVISYYFKRQYEANPHYGIRAHTFFGTFLLRMM
jgi:hypothetical protein